MKMTTILIYKKITFLFIYSESRNRCVRKRESLSGNAKIYTTLRYDIFRALLLRVSFTGG